MPIEGTVRRAGRRRAFEGAPGLDDGDPRSCQGGMRPFGHGPLPRQRRARRFFLAASEVEHDVGTKTEGTHR
ncbi:MAG: hypothetical protein KA371_19625 [Acidobacteria bacterium]|nr:hypothetical protein [Acidobacteriota bacterium]